jgi:hemerythrin
MDEQYRKASSYPALPEQIEFHRSFTKRLAELQREFTKNGRQPNIVSAIQNELSLWIKSRVLGLYQAFWAYSKEQGKKAAS